MRQHIIVSGENALATIIVEQLQQAGASVARLKDPEHAGIRVEAELARAGVSKAAAVVCAGDDDAKNLKIALLSRKASPNIPVVARMANEVLREALAADDEPMSTFGVADLAAPAIVEACLETKTHPFEAAGIRFMVAATQAPYDATLRELYDSLAPLAVVRGDRTDIAGNAIFCPPRDAHVSNGDWLAMVGTTEELAIHGLVPPRQERQRVRRSPIVRSLSLARAMASDISPAFYPAIAALGMTIAISTTILHYSYGHPGMSWVDAFYFTIETVTTTGYGDFSFAQQDTWLRIYAALLMFGGVTSIALLVSFISDVLLSRRFAWASGRSQAQHLRNHVVVIGLSDLGVRVVTELTGMGHDVAVIERDPNNPFVHTMADLEVPVIFGDATLRQTLLAARIDRARGVAVVTRDDMINIETGVVLQEMLAAAESADEFEARSNVPLVLRVYDPALGSEVAHRFGFENVRSSVELAAPWFIGAALGLNVLGTFWIGNRAVLIGKMDVQAGSELDGLKMFEMSTHSRVIAITRDDAPVQINPRRDARLRGGDTVFLIGPYRELLATLRKGQGKSGSRST